ncbi:nitrite reductase small subunit NirD [Cytophagaceae bacterium DM2B3-1]|uniref:Nitrite reductase small subunit NirD n=2 Tax=Xanthocytophaga flava TaxID=3048013 RepID=A0ABT7CFV0_9BACT|nr:nitrite reductase small subunit NirD [Xanthocytophaga flavus]MDJ1492548.1 nitrite reductase small subunit NirD [Xanthocytophaga flavus]
MTMYAKETETDVQKWFLACSAGDIPQDGGACVKYNDKQIAVFNFARRNEWFATDNLCPHRQQMVLSRGMIGTQGDEPKVACPFHKKTFSLKTGECLSGDDCTITTYPVKIEDGFVYINVASL